MNQQTTRSKKYADVHTNPFTFNKAKWWKSTGEASLAVSSVPALKPERCPALPPPHSVFCSLSRSLPPVPHTIRLLILLPCGEIPIMVCLVYSEPSGGRASLLHIHSSKMFFFSFCQLPYFQTLWGQSTPNTPGGC